MTFRKDLTKLVFKQERAQRARAVPPCHLANTARPMEGREGRAVMGPAAAHQAGVRKAGDLLLGGDSGDWPLDDQSGCLWQGPVRGDVSLRTASI